MTKSRGHQPTLKDVAARANVSKQTISRVINNKGEVSEATRKRVLKVIREIGYHPNALARSLVTSRTLVIGLTVPNIDQPYFPQIARGVEDAAAENGYSVFLCNATGGQDREIEAIERLRGHQVGGIISFGSRLTDEVILRTVGGLCPVVMVNREVPGARGTVIWPGYKAGAQLAVEHLLQIGRKRILFLGMDPGSNVDDDKRRGYITALEQAGIPVESDLIAQTAGPLDRRFLNLVESGEETINLLLEHKLQFDGIFASNDLRAIGAIRSIIEHGRKVPEDVAIVGFGGANVTGIVTPPVSTVTMPLYEMGRAAFHALLDDISDKKHESHLVNIQPELIVRESSAYPADR